jgi:hypothetical protein
MLNQCMIQMATNREFSNEAPSTGGKKKPSGKNKKGGK